MARKGAFSEVGLTGTVVCKKSFPDSDISNIMILNDVGGSSFLPPGRYRVRVTHGFDDYETGRRLHGELMDKKDIEKATKAGTTGYAGRRPGVIFNPKKVYFSGDDFVPEKK